MHIRLNHDPSTLDPAHIVDVTGGAISAKLFNGLVRFNERLELVPDIAERWDISSDGRSYTFYLRRNVVFHNMRNLKAEDIRYSFQRVLDPDTRSPNTWVLDRISGAEAFISGRAETVSGIEVLDDYTVRMTLKEPFSPFLNMLAMSAAYIVPEEEVERWGKEFSSHPSGTGPFLLNDWKHNLHVRLDRNDLYFEGRPHIKGILYRVMPEDITASTEFELGNLDILSIPASEYRRFRDSSRWSGLISSTEGLNTYYLGLNCSRPPFDDARARRAVAMAIDRAKILAAFYEGRGRIASGPVPDMLRKWESPAQLPFDQAGARELAEQTGLAGRTLDFYVSSDPENIDMAEIVQFYLEKVGISVMIRPYEWSAYKAAINNGEPDMFWLSWWADYPDPENFLFPLFHSSNFGPGGNRTRYKNDKVDGLIEKARRSTTSKEMVSSLAAAERLITGEYPMVFFWHKNEYIVRQPGLKNFRLFSIYSIDKAMEISF